MDISNTVVVCIIAACIGFLAAVFTTPVVDAIAAYLTRRAERRACARFEATVRNVFADAARFYLGRAGR